MRIARGLHLHHLLSVIEIMYSLHHANEAVNRKSAHGVIVTDTKLIAHYCVKVFRTLIVGMIESTLNKQENGIVRTFTLQADGLMYR